MIFVMFGVASGVSFAFLRYPFLPLLPIGALLAAGALLTGIFFWLSSRTDRSRNFRIDCGAAVCLRSR